MSFKLIIGLISCFTAQILPNPSGQVPARTTTPSFGINDNLQRGDDEFRHTGKLTERQIEEGWISLFDGESLFGWEKESDANWRVEAGAITVDHGKTPGILRTTIPFDDFELRLDFKSTRGVNSGIFLRTAKQPADPGSDCYELNIVDDESHRFPTGSFVARQVAAQPSLKVDRWQSLAVTATGGDFKVVIDGATVCEWSDPSPLGRGFIGLQYNQGKISFRDIHLKPAGLEPIFNGRDLDGWTIAPDMDGQFSVSDEGWLHVVNGPGQLESKNEYADFFMQTNCRVNEADLNSGIFFRCVPGEKTNGYEAQIHNGILDGNRNRPSNGGTGGIFRRCNARRVMADDKKWFAMTIAAAGPHISVWVNGFQVCDWTDERTPHENPRLGQRLQAGTLMIQAHDPTTDLYFRNLFAKELTARTTKIK